MRAGEQPLAIGAVRAWLEAHDGWLLVFDNAQQAEDLEDHLPRQSRGQVIVTSRNQIWRGRVQPLAVQVLANTSAADFLLERTGRVDRSAAETLANELGNLPLALEQAAA
jgi:hypothetical protein